MSEEKEELGERFLVDGDSGDAPALVDVVDYERVPVTNLYLLAEFIVERLNGICARLAALEKGATDAMRDGMREALAPTLARIEEHAATALEAAPEFGRRLAALEKKFGEKP